MGIRRCVDEGADRAEFTLVFGERQLGHAYRVRQISHGAEQSSPWNENIPTLPKWVARADLERSGSPQFRRRPHDIGRWTGGHLRRSKPMRRHGFLISAAMLAALSLPGAASAINLVNNPDFSISRAAWCRR